MVRIYTVKLNQIFSKQKGVVMAKHDIDSWILDETELAEHYKDIGKPEGYDSKMELVGLLKQLKEYQHLEEQDRIIKFYHCESLNEYYIGKRCGNFYYAEAEVQPNGDICLYYKWSRYLPWGETVVDELSLWKECTYPSEPKEISFEEWLKGWLCEAEAKLKELRGGND